MKYLIITKKIWDKKNFSSLDKKKFVISKKLKKNYISKLKFKFVFFIHWSEYIPSYIYEKFECIQFHSSNLPKGRGGSPIQNQILMGKNMTKLCAFKVVKQIDGGPIYFKKNLSLKGSAADILKRMEKLSVDIIKKIVKSKNLLLKKQTGAPTFFKRRTPKQSEINKKYFSKVDKFYDFVRMLDADGYPKSFFVKNNIKFEFKNIRKLKNIYTSNVIVRTYDKN